MYDAIDSAKKELSRADHLFHVSLKYTRTGDTLNLIIKRLMNAIDFGIEALLRDAKEKEQIPSIPTLPIARINKIRNLYSEDKLIKNIMEFYLLLRKISKSRTECVLEFRRHVTMTCHFDADKIEITIDIIGDYYKKTKEFINHIEQILSKDGDN